MGNRSRLGGGALVAAAGMGLAGREVVRRGRRADLRGQVALITGGARGLGLLLARELAGRGCRLVICSRTGEQLQRAREDLERGGAEVLAIECDVADRSQAERLIEEATRCFGRVDLLINNASIIQLGPVHTMSLEDFEEAMAINFWGGVYPTLAVLPQMLERKNGRIIFIGSVGGKVSVPHLLPYNCAKFAITGFGEGLAAELAREGIAVTTIAPGVMRTGSYLNIAVKGKQNQEFGWFAAASSLPLASIDAERAARHIIRAIERGDTERIISTPANLLARFHGLFPGTTVEILGVVNRFLPKPEPASAHAEHAMNVQKRMQSPVMNALTRWGRSAASRFNQESARK